MLFPATIGEDQPRPGRVALHSMLVVFDHFSGSFELMDEGFDAGPRKPGHSGSAPNTQEARNNGARRPFMTLLDNNWQKISLDTCCPIPLAHPPVNADFRPYILLTLLCPRSSPIHVATRILRLAVVGDECRRAASPCIASNAADAPNPITMPALATLKPSLSIWLKILTRSAPRATRTPISRVR